MLILAGILVVGLVWVGGSFWLQGKLNQWSKRDDWWGELIRQVGKGITTGQEFQLSDLPRTMAVTGCLALLVVLTAVMALRSWGPLAVALPGAGVAAYIAAPRLLLRDPPKLNRAEAAAARINAEPDRFLYLLDVGLATRFEDDEKRVHYAAREGVDAFAAAADGRSVVVELDVFSYKTSSAYQDILERMVASPFLAAHTGELLPSAPAQLRALIDLEPLPQGEQGEHILDRVPRPELGTLELGIRAGGRPLVVDLATKPNGIAVGPTRGGKSVQLNQLGAELLLIEREDGSPDYDLSVASTKNRADFAALEGAARVFGSDGQAAFTQHVLEAVAEGKRLAARLEREGVAKLDDLPLSERPRKRAFILDECREWLLAPSRPPKGTAREETLEYALAEAFGWLYTKSGFLGWLSLLAHQAPKFESFGHRGGEVISNSGWRLAFGHLHTTTRSLVMEGTEGDTEGGAAHGIQGRANVWMDGGAGLTEFQGFAVAAGEHEVVDRATGELRPATFAERVTLNIRRDLMQAGRLRP